ncbi:MAG TPA: endo alpha-1,4 polygalactosaminidase [Aliiroseovarius sp.]|nr:endo alpha-1,4 polygalactosaminidase [Aliiroseovarius sp.]
MKVGSVLLALLPAVAGAAPVRGVDWDWQLSEKIDPPAGITAFDADKDSVTRGQVAALTGAGVYTICYVSVGTLERYRADAAHFPKAVVGKTYGDWPDEKFLDIRRLDVLLPLMRARFERCKALGFDAIEPDNMDVYDNDSGFDLTADDTVRYITALADLAHGMGLEFGQKNVPELTDRLIGKMDFIVTESCFQDSWCQDVVAYPQAGKPVFDAEYTDRPINWQRACKTAAWLNISMILKDRDLTPGRKSCNE